MKLRAIVIAAIVLATVSARADKTDKEKLADREFADGKRLIAAGRIAEASERFHASFEADPALGTLLNLADCNDKLGKTATALDEFQAALGRAIAARDSREGFARARIAAIEPKISKLVIDSPTATPGLVVKRDGNDVALGTEIAVDRGSYKIEASATGYDSWSTSVEVTEPGTKRVEVPPLTRPAPSPIAQPPVVAAPIIPNEMPAPLPSTSERPRPIAAISVTAAAVACAGAAVLFELSSRSNYKAAQHAPDQPQLDAAYDTANSRYKLAQGFGVVALGLAGASVYLWVSRGHDAGATHVTANIAPGLSGLSLEGSF